LFVIPGAIERVRSRADLKQVLVDLDFSLGP
jgi:hypothetical protein